MNTHLFALLCLSLGHLTVERRKAVQSYLVDGHAAAFLAEAEPLLNQCNRGLFILFLFVTKNIPPPARGQLGFVKVVLGAPQRLMKYPFQEVTSKRGKPRAAHVRLSSERSLQKPVKSCHFVFSLPIYGYAPLPRAPSST
jgi:hypothetical protein